MTAVHKPYEQIAREALVRVVASYHDKIRNDPRCINNLLNDICPEQKDERFKLSSVLELNSFRAKLGNMSVQEYDLERLKYALVDQLGFGPLTSEWVADSWGIALKIYKPNDLNYEFSCPNCFEQGIAGRHWRRRTLICPRCKSIIEFSNELEPSIVKIGWKKKRATDGIWLFVEKNKIAATKVSKTLAENVYNLVVDETLSSGEKAERIDLVSIVAYLTEETASVLKELRIQQTFAGMEFVIRGILKGAFRQGEIHLFPDLPTDRLDALGICLPVEIVNRDQVIGLIGTAHVCEPQTALIFGKEHFVFVGEFGKGWIAYQDLNSVPITMEGLATSFKIGLERTVSVRGLGISRRAVVKVLNTISESVRGINEFQHMSQQ